MTVDERGVTVDERGVTVDERDVTPSITIGPSELAIVVGASGAIGSVVVERLLAEGATVLGVARSAAGLSRFDASARFEGAVADATDPDFEDVMRTLVAGRATRLVINAARPPEAGHLLEIDPGLLARGVDVKVGGLLRLVRACDAHLVVGSRIIGFGGRLGYDPEARAPVASVANAALANLIRQLGRELGPRGVTAHVVAPGPVDTRRLDRVAAGASESDRARFIGRTPLGRLPTPQEVVAAAFALIGPAGDLLNGGSLLLDGGQRTAVP